MITLRWSLWNHFHSYTCILTASWSAFVLDSLPHFKMILRKPRSLMQPTKNEMESIHNMSLPFDHTCCLGKSDLETCLHFSVSENRNRKLRSESSFLFPLLPIVQFDVVHQHLGLRHKQHTNSCKQHVLNLHVLVSLCLLDSLDSFQLREFLILRVPHLLRFPFRHLYETLQSVRCHHQLAQHLDEECSLDLRANCSTYSSPDC